MTVSVPPSRRALPASKPRRAALRAAGEGGGGGDQRPERPAGEAEAGADEVLGLHAVQPGGAGDGGDLRARTGDGEHEVEGVDRLCDEDAAAVAGVGAAARRVVVGLRPPPGEPTCTAARAPSCARGGDGGKGAGGAAHPVLEDDPEGDAGVVAEIHELGRGGGTALERLLGKDMLSGAGRGLDDRPAGVGRGQEEDRLHAGVGEHRLERGGGGQAVAGGEGGAAGGVAGEDAADLDLTAEPSSARACTSATMPKPTIPIPSGCMALLPVARSRCGSGGRLGQAAA